MHDSRVLDDLIDPDNEDPGVWADSAYRSEETERVLEAPATTATSTKKDTVPTRSLTSSKPTIANVPRSVPGSSTSSAFKKTA